MPKAMYFLSTPILCFILLFPIEGKPRVQVHYNTARAVAAGGMAGQRGRHSWGQATQALGTSRFSSVKRKGLNEIHASVLFSSP